MDWTEGYWRADLYDENYLGPVLSGNWADPTQCCEDLFNQITEKQDLLRDAKRVVRREVKIKKRDFENDMALRKNMRLIVAIKNNGRY